MSKAVYNISGQLEGSSWEDFISDDGPSVCIKKGDHMSISICEEDGWYDVVVPSFSEKLVIAVLKLISNKDEIKLVEHRTCMAA